MGFTVKFNWVLQCEPAADLQAGREFPFEKSGNRVFPLDTPIDLIDPNRNAIAKIKIVHFRNESTLTTGTYTVSKVYAGHEKSVLSNYWKENQ